MLRTKSFGNTKKLASCRFIQNGTSVFSKTKEILETQKHTSVSRLTYECCLNYITSTTKVKGNSKCENEKCFHTFLNSVSWNGWTASLISHTRNHKVIDEFNAVHSINLFLTLVVFLLCCVQSETIMLLLHIHMFLYCFKSLYTGASGMR